MKTQLLPRNSWSNSMSLMANTYKLLQTSWIASCKNMDQRAHIWRLKVASWIRRRLINISETIWVAWESKNGYLSTSRRIRLRPLVLRMTQRLESVK